MSKRYFYKITARDGCVYIEGDVLGSIKTQHGYDVNIYVENGSWFGTITSSGFLYVWDTKETYDLKDRGFRFEWESKEPTPLQEIPF